MITKIMSTGKSQIKRKGDKSLIFAQAVFLVLCMHVNAVSLTRTPIFAEATDVNINVPKILENAFGVVFKTKNNNGDALLRDFSDPVPLNINMPQNQRQYNVENYQYVPPPLPSHVPEGYYPLSTSNSYNTAYGYYAPGFYSAATIPQSWNKNQQFSLPHYQWPNWNNQYQNHQYLPQPPQFSSNPYMRPTNPLQTNPGPMMGIYDELNTYPKTPFGQTVNTSQQKKPLRKGIIITPDSPLYVHTPEEPTTLDIDPRR